MTQGVVVILQTCILHAIHVMKISNYKGTREAYTALLEKIVDASLRMGLELNLRQQSALAMLLEGASYNDIAQSFNISRSDAVIMTNDAVNELKLFLNRLGSIERIQEEADKKIERYKTRYRQQIRDLHDEIERLKGDIKSKKGNGLKDISIHHLPISPKLMSILFKAGYITLGDVAKEDRDVLKGLPGMTKDMMRDLEKYIELSNNAE